MTYSEFKNKYGIILDPDQDRACEKSEGNLLLLAVPGSGKTSVMVARLGYLVKGLGVPPDSVLAVTYSVAGAKEMQKRYESIFGSREIEIRTINGFCAKVIEYYERLCGRHAFRLIETDSQLTGILCGIMKECGGYPSENEIKDVKTAITFCSNMMYGEKEISDKISVEGRDFPEIFHRYRRFKIANRLMDYDDQLRYAYSIMCRYEEVNRAYSGRFSFICVDEAQDTSKIQHMIVRKAAENCRSLFMVGDEDQSIYGFRAAYPKALLEFDKIYPSASVYFIEKNYRSTKKIVSAADRFIALNSERRGKHMVTDNPDGCDIRHTELQDLKDLPEYIKSAASAASAEPDETTAVLCRLNDSIIPFVDLLVDSGIPFSFRTGDGLFFTHYIVKDVIAIMKFASDPFSVQLFEKLYYKFSAGISRDDYEYAVTHNYGKKMLSYPEYFSLCSHFSERQRRKMKKVSEALFKINSSDSFAAIKLILSDSGYGTYISHRTKDLSKINTLLAIAERHRPKDEFFERLGFLSDKIKEGNNSKNGIVFSTIHSAKGMEFDNVILCDAKNGILPSITEPSDGIKFKESEKELLEEERRIFYVAVTRAKKRLELVTYRREFGRDCSGWDFVGTLMGTYTDRKKYLYEKNAEEEKENAEFIKKQISSYTSGDCIMHKVFGEGTIVLKQGNVAKIRFYRYKFPKKVDLFLCIEKELIRHI